MARALGTVSLPSPSRAPSSRKKPMLEALLMK
jgi:hypothetical protein